MLQNDQISLQSTVTSYREIHYRCTIENPPSKESPTPLCMSRNTTIDEGQDPSRRTRSGSGEHLFFRERHPPHSQGFGVGREASENQFRDWLDQSANSMVWIPRLVGFSALTLYLDVIFG